MHLKNYPEAIATSALSVLEVRRSVRQIQAECDRVLSLVEREIAFDKSLTNEAQRKARRTDLLESRACAATFEVLDAAKDQLAEAEIEHQLLLNRFSVAKLEMREGIAKLESEHHANR